MTSTPATIACFLLCFLVGLAWTIRDEMHAIQADLAACRSTPAIPAAFTYIPPKP